MKKILLAGLLSLFALPSFTMAQVTPTADVDTVEQSSLCITLSNNLRYRMRDASVNNEVSDLQDFLNMNGYLKSGPTGYFGLATLDAVKRFQKANGFVPTGYVGPLTRAKINAISCGGGETTTMGIPVAIPATQVTPTISTPVVLYPQGQATATPATSPSLPAGCTSTVGYSSLTGKRCLVPVTLTTTTNLAITTPASLPNAKVGQSYSVALNTSGGSGSDYKWSVDNGATGFPITGLGFNSSYGNTVYIIGVPSKVYISGVESMVPNTFTFNVTVTSGSQSTTKQFTLTVDPIAAPTATPTVTSFTVIDSVKFAGSKEFSWTTSNVSGNNTDYVDFIIDCANGLTIKNAVSGVAFPCGTKKSMPESNGFVLDIKNTTSAPVSITASVRAVGGTGYNPASKIVYLTIPAAATVASCPTPWGSSVANGSSVYAYQFQSVPPGPASCIAQTRTCSSGVLSGNYQYATCSTQVTSVVPTVEFIGTPTLSLQYDSAGKESVLVGNIAFKITAGNSDIMFSSDINYPTIPYVMAFNGCCSGSWVINGPTSIKAGATATYTGTLTSPTKVMFAGTYNISPSTLGYSVNGVWQNLDSSSFKNARSSNSVTIIGETSPYITSAVYDTASGNINISGARFYNATANTVTINGVTKVLPSANAAATLINAVAKDFGITATGVYQLQVSTSEGASNMVNVSVMVVLPTTGTVSVCSQGVTINGTTYTLSPCSIDMSMVDGQGNKNFTVTLIPSGGSSANFGYSVRGYGVGFPTYGILGASSGGAMGSTPLNLYFNDSYLSADGNNAKTYTGYLPIHIFQGSETGNDNNYLNLNINLTVSPATSAAAMAPSSQLASLIGAFSSPSVQTPTPVLFPAPTWAYTWMRNLEIGSPYADDTTALQTALIKEGVYTGEVSGGFYTQTYLAVKAFQKKYGIESTGFVGPQTRAKLNELY